MLGFLFAMRYLVGLVIWFNGSFLGSDDAKLSPLDAGLQHGVGLFETLQARNGHVFCLQDHLQRLRRSATELELMSSLHIEPLTEAVGEVVKKWGDSDARIQACGHTATQSTSILMPPGNAAAWMVVRAGLGEGKNAA